MLEDTEEGKKVVLAYRLLHRVLPFSTRTDTFRRREP